MTYVDESLILFLASSSTYLIPETVLHLLLAYLPHDAKILSVCQSLGKRRKKDSIPE